MMDMETRASIPVAVYEPVRGLALQLRLRELWDYRELLYFLTLRDIQVRYKQAALGVGWAVLQPLLTMIIFTVVFGRLANLQSDGIPYPVFSFTALLPWQLFSGALSRAGSSLVNNSQLITKIYFPRLVIPLSAVAAGLLDFGISLVVLFILMACYGIQLTWAVLWLPLLVLLALLTALAVGLWLSALNVQYRDVQHLIPFLVQAWMYASPVAYSTTLVPSGTWRILYGLNPLAGVIQGFRWALLGSTPPDGLFLVSIAVVLVLLVTGLLYFQRMESTFADVV
jgi:lipopolysaccharide transport system permease protein